MFEWPHFGIKEFIYDQTDKLSANMCGVKTKEDLKQLQYSKFQLQQLAVALLVKQC